MSDNTWPDPKQPGVPLNPERDGWHWVCAAVGIAAPYPMLWCADGKAWDTGDGWEFCTSPRMTERTRYLGLCLTPAEVEARVQQARRDALEEAARVAEEHEKKAQAKLDELTVKFFSEDPSVGKASSPTAMIVNSRKIAAAIRALKGEGND